jgi:hypothetical protein
MHMVLLNVYLGWQLWMARAGGDLRHAMPSYHAHSPNQVTCRVALYVFLTEQGGDFGNATPSCLAHSLNKVTT